LVCHAGIKIFSPFKYIFMKNQNTFYVFLLFLAPLSIFGQTVSLGGSIYAIVSKNEQKTEQYAFKDNNVQAFLIPTYSVFLTKQLMVGGSITVGGLHNQSKITDFWYTDAKVFSGAIAPSIRYYFFDDSKWRPFGSFRVEYSGSKSNSSYTDLSGTVPSKTASSAWHFEPTLGSTYFFSDDAALELALSHRQTYYEFNGNKSAFNSTVLNVGFQNFLTIKPKVKKSKALEKEASPPNNETPPQSRGSRDVPYLHRGKWLAGGSTTLSRFSEGTHFSKDFNLNINPEIGYFLTKNAVIGTSGYLNISKNSKKYWNIEPFVRFYQPILPSLALYAEARMTHYNLLTTDFPGAEKEIFRNQYHLSLGYNYFLSQRVALEGALYQFDYLKIKEFDIRTIVNHEFGVQARIRYFLN
jgi:hypothetical protein